MNKNDKNVLAALQRFIDDGSEEKLTDEELDRYLELKAQAEKEAEKEAEKTVDYSRWELNHVMDPETEDLVYGKNLKNGMKVLIEDRLSFSNPRELETEERYPGQHDRLRKDLDTNYRWATVTELDVVKRFEGKTDMWGELKGEQYEVSPLTKFIAVYEDGTKASRSYDGGYAWFVKKDSLLTDETIGQLADALVNDFFGGIFSHFFEDLSRNVEECTICSPEDTMEEALQKHADFETEKKGESTGFEDAADQPMPHWEKELLHGRDGDPEHEPDEDGNCKQCDENEARRERESNEALAALRAKLTGDSTAGDVTPPDPDQELTPAGNTYASVKADTPEDPYLGKD